MGVMRADNPGLVRAAMEAGMKHFDTAHGYQKGKNETMLGEVLKEFPRESFFLATKIPPDSKEGFLEKLDLSLQRLQMTYVDILYVHAVSSRDGVLDPALLDAVTTAKKTGKVRHVGVSTHKNEPEVIRAAIESGVYEIVLTSINFKQEHYPDLKNAIAEAAKAGLGIVAMKTMAGAFYDKGKTKPINCKAALKWALQDPNVTTSIPGITSYDHLSQNASVMRELALTPEETLEITAGKSESGLFCTGCDSCVDTCRRMLPMQDLMRSYMYAYGYGETALARELLSTIHVDNAPCHDCSSCTATCAKGFDLRDRITDISRLAHVPEEFLA
jgi:predicted aldo/keto reductase-like oxidoreductase